MRSTPPLQRKPIRTKNPPPDSTTPPEAAPPEAAPPEASATDPLAHLPEVYISRAKAAYARTERPRFDLRELADMRSGIDLALPKDAKSQAKLIDAGLTAIFLAGPLALAAALDAALHGAPLDLSALEIYSPADVIALREAAGLLSRSRMSVADAAQFLYGDRSHASSFGSGMGFNISSTATEVRDGFRQFRAGGLARPDLLAEAGLGPVKLAEIDTASATVTSIIKGSGGRDDDNAKKRYYLHILGLALEEFIPSVRGRARTALGENPTALEKVLKSVPRREQRRQPAPTGDKPKTEPLDKAADPKAAGKSTGKSSEEAETPAGATGAAGGAPEDKTPGGAEAPKK